VIDPARERVILDRAATPLKPCEQACSNVTRQFELNRSTRLLLYDDRPCPNVGA
jgi:hypothetical protein